MKNKFTALLFILLSLQTSLFSQNRYDLSRFGDESVKFISRPVSWDGNNWVKLGLVGAGTLLLMIADQPVIDAALKDQSYYKSFPIEAGRIWGEIYPTAAIAGVFGLHGLLANDLSTKKIGFEIVQSAIYAGAITTVLKTAIGRARPFTGSGPAKYHPFTFFDDDFHSLPSGHTTLAFSLSTVLSKNANSDLLKVIAYIPAVLTAVSRVYQDNHWASDVFLGAAIGYFVGDWVTGIHDRESDNPQVSLYPLSIRISIR